MRNIFIAGLFFMVATVPAIAAETNTALDSRWICTTNASSSSLEAEKTADNQMENTQKSAADAFAFAAGHCRDCTKITCKAK